MSMTLISSMQFRHATAVFKITRHPCIPGEEEAEADGEEFICLMGL